MTLLKAFWFPGQRTFKPLTGQEWRARLGRHITTSEKLQLLHGNLITVEPYNGNGDDNLSIYALTSLGRERVETMLNAAPVKLPRIRRAGA